MYNLKILIDLNYANATKQIKMPAVLTQINVMLVMCSTFQVNKIYLFETNKIVKLELPTVKYLIRNDRKFSIIYEQVMWVG